MTCDFDYIDPTNNYKKRFPTDCKDKTQNTKHLLNDSHADIQLYSLYQSLSYAVDIKNDKGEIIGHETRVNVKDVPNQTQVGKLLGITRKTVREHQNYLLNPSTENIYCPYITLSEDGTYYILPEKESKYAFLPQSIIQYLLKGFSPDAIRIYIFFFAMNNWFQHELEEEEKEKAKKLKIPDTNQPAQQETMIKNENANVSLSTEQSEENETPYFTFTIKEVASNIGMSVENWQGRSDIWAFDEERAKIDPSYQLGSIPTAMIALRNGKLIEWDIKRNDLGHKMYRLKKVNADIATIIPNDTITLMTQQDKKGRKTSKKVIKKHGVEVEEELTLPNTDTTLMFQKERWWEDIKYEF